MLIPFVRMAIGEIGNLIIAKDVFGEPIGFMGVENSKIEMLFIGPDYFNMGIGKVLVDYAINEYGAKLVDVNEQNSQAHGFYQHIGFRVYDRSETDEQGNPFPILHMKLDRMY